MASQLQREIRQTRPFDSVKQEAMLNLLRTAAVLTHRMEANFRPWGLTATQYNVLRIVRGAGPVGVSQCDIAARLVAETPDVPRLLQRTEEAGLIERRTDAHDRRMRQVCLTDKGENLLAEVDAVLPRWTAELFLRLSPAELDTLNHLLAEARYMPAAAIPDAS